MNNLGTTYTDAEAATIIRSLVAHNEHDGARANLASERKRALSAAQEADAAERELAHANPFQADEGAWTNERALQEAQTEKEACHA